MRLKKVFPAKPYRSGFFKAMLKSGPWGGQLILYRDLFLSPHSILSNQSYSHEVRRKCLPRGLAQHRFIIHQRNHECKPVQYQEHMCSTPTAKSPLGATTYPISLTKRLTQSFFLIIGVGLVFCWFGSCKVRYPKMTYFITLPAHSTIKAVPEDSLKNVKTTN